MGTRPERVPRFRVTPGFFLERERERRGMRAGIRDWHAWLMASLAAAPWSSATGQGCRRKAMRVVPAPMVLLDAGTAQAVEGLLVRLDRGGGTDALAERLYGLFELFPPEEALLQRLSLLQQRVAGTGGRVEFCATTAYMAAMAAVAQGHVRVRPRCMRSGGHAVRTGSRRTRRRAHSSGPGVW